MLLEILRAAPSPAWMRMRSAMPHRWPLEADRMLAGNAEFYNLPRKFKISITGCRVWCPYPEINDIGLTAVERVLHGKSEIGFALRVGGGLSSEPNLGAPLNA